MSNITRFKAIVDAIRDADTSAEQLDRIANHFVSFNRDNIIAMELDPDNLTNNQKAAVVLSVLRRYAKKIVKREARIDALQSVDSTIDTAIDNAEGDLD